MREIKFRAFDTVNRQMVAVRTIDFDEVGEVEEVNTSTYVWSQNANPPNLDKLILMQFTGLHDKDGKEIYEGDIVTCPQFPRPLFVKWDNNGYFLFENICNEANLGGDNDCVIGNIFENPELVADSPQPQAMSRDKIAV